VHTDRGEKMRCVAFSARVTMTEFDHIGNGATADWLTEVLKRNGYLASGEVVVVNQKASGIGTTLTSQFFDLTLEYSAGSAGARPVNLLMKVGKAERFSLARKEAAFYELVRQADRSAALLTSFGTAVDEATRSAVILMQDLRETTFTTEWPIPPQLDACEGAVTALAGIHAMRWASPALADETFERITDKFAGLDSEPARLLLAAFFDALGDGISPSRRATLEWLLEQYPRLLRQRAAQTNLQTLVHGDAHFWNVLLPTDVSQSAVWIDWQSWGVAFGAYDLAYMIGLHWFPERRNRFETTLLKAYHCELEQHGIQYSYDELTYDYRLQVAGQLVVPFVQWSMKIPAYVWWHHLDRGFSAFDDLNCRELF
jgi:hypothetical protein